MFSMPSRAEPTPFCAMMLQLAEYPAPLTAIIYPIPAQQAQANTPFYFNIKCFISESPIEVNYWVTNLSKAISKEDKKNIRGIISYTEVVLGLPNGVVQTSQKPGDCPVLFILNDQIRSCRLHFDVNTSAYTSLQGGYGPVIASRVNWMWGSHHNRHGATNITTIPRTTETIANVLAPIMQPTTALVTPIAQDGLSYDAATSSIIGTPTRSGLYRFLIRAVNGHSVTAPQPLDIDVAINPHDQPVFKQHYRIPSAMMAHDYQINLMSLIDSPQQFAANNPTRFRIDSSREHPAWLNLDSERPTLLKGHVPLMGMGGVTRVTLIATSNTGGDSKPLTIDIPVVYDPALRPIMQQNIQLAGAVGFDQHDDLAQYITDPTPDGSLRVILDKIEPAAPWLSISATNPTALAGVAPNDAVGQCYQITAYANTQTGGNSVPVTISLQLAIDANKTPRFATESPQLPALHAGESYLYDFTHREDIHPLYKDIPYHVELASNKDNPPWLRIVNNQLIAAMVPDNIKKEQKIFITIKNIPGGESAELSISLYKKID